MMSWLEAVILGAVQGATEFLPVSSSGHLVLGQTLLGLDEPQLLFDVVLHVGTLVSVLVFYRRDILGILTGLWDGAQAGASERSLAALFRPEGAKLAALVVLATIPTGLLGVALERLLDPDDGQRVLTARIVCVLLLVNGAILMANAWFQRREHPGPERTGLLTLWNVSLGVALVIGVAQGFAVLPGISRSGMTITVALALGIERLKAARYSFLLSIPAILGALVLKFDAAIFSGPSDTLVVFLGGAAVAAGVGYACLLLLTRVLERAQFHHFSWYCWALSIFGLITL
ncbi:MAG: undecaprenyl-diphosphate phosphatase [Myxococcota bacterium]